MNGKANRRIDFLLDCLLRIEMDNYFKYMEKDVLLPINHKVTREEERHKRGLDIPDDQVKVCNNVICFAHVLPGGVSYRELARENG